MTFNPQPSDALDPQTSKAVDKALDRYKSAITDNSGSAWEQEERITEAKAAIAALLTEAVQATHDIYPDKEYYYSQKALDAAVTEARISELENTGFDKRLNDPILHCYGDNPITKAERLAELRQQGGNLND